MNNFDFGGCDCLWLILLLMCCGGLGNNCGGSCNCNNGCTCSNNCSDNCCC